MNKTTSYTPILVKSRSRCLFCQSRACYNRIYTPDGAFDHVASRKHQDALCLHADAVLGNPGTPRVHSSSTDRLKRGNVAEDYADFLRGLDRLKEIKIAHALRSGEGVWV